MISPSQLNYQESLAIIDDIKIKKTIINIGRPSPKSHNH